jgi:PhnB protein
MATINPYLNFKGNTEEAFNFYKSVFGGEFITLLRWKDMPEADKISVGEQEKIMHVALPIGQGNVLMGADCLESMGHTLTVGNNFFVSISTESEYEADRLFKGLSAGGQATMPLQKTFWGAYFGMLIDKFGIQWMVSYDYNQLRTIYLLNKGMHGVLDLLGPTVEFLTLPSEADAVYCVMKGTVPPGVSVPLHSHPDDESFFILSGVIQVLNQRGDSFEWLDVKADGFVHVPSGAKHAWRNTSRLGRFFQEVGRPVTPGAPPPPPTPDDIQHFTQVAAKYHHWMGSATENAAIGISLFE